MGKSILVIDTPDCCMECPMRFLSGRLRCGKLKYRRLYSCRYAPSDAEDFYLKDPLGHEKPNWCPLREVPQKMAEENRWFSKDYAQGWNTCIDEILKEGD